MKSHKAGSKCSRGVSGTICSVELHQEFSKDSNRAGTYDCRSAESLVFESPEETRDDGTAELLKIVMNNMKGLSSHQRTTLIKIQKDMEER